MYKDIDSFVSDRDDALIITSPATGTLPFLETVVEKQMLPRIIVAPVAFALRYKNRPYYAALVTLLGTKGYSLFNLYNVERKQGQVTTAQALFIDKRLRDVFVEKIRV